MTRTILAGLACTFLGGFAVVAGSCASSWWLASAGAVLTLAGLGLAVETALQREHQQHRAGSGDEVPRG